MWSLLLSWLLSYTTNRRQQVKIDYYLSERFNMTSVIPQGGHQSPLPFILFVNDLNNIFNFCQYNMLFVDDLKLFAWIQTVDDCIGVQNYWNIFVHWCSLNGLIINVSKCFQISFTRLKNSLVYNNNINDVKLKRVNSSDLSFNLHVDAMMMRL